MRADFLRGRPHPSPISEYPSGDRVERLLSRTGEPFPVVLNPGPLQVEGMSQGGLLTLRGWLSPDDRAIFIWQGSRGTHGQVHYGLSTEGWHAFWIDGPRVLGSGREAIDALASSDRVAAIFATPFEVSGLLDDDSFAPASIRDPGGFPARQPR